MGDRGNIVLRYDSATKPKEVFLYTHWGGSELPVVLQDALKRKARWEDDSYLARIIFCELVKGQEAEETGYGIGVHQPDNSHDYLVVDFDAQMVRQEDPETRRLKGKWSFEEFCGLVFESGVDCPSLRDF